MESIRTDLAIENKEIYEKKFKRELDGIVVEEEKIDEIKITTVDIINENGAKKMGKAQGRYVTIDMPLLAHYDPALKEQAEHVFAGNLEKMINLKEGETALVVGLGNVMVTPDALGPKVIDKIMVTRHIEKCMPEEMDDTLRSVCAISPGVLGTTGIETSEVIKSLVDKIKPSLVVCIDSLATRSLERVARSIQITDTGINPGSGVGNERMKISEETLGVKVIAVGVPMVVDAATIANDAMDLVIDEMIEKSKENKEFYSMLKEIDKKEKSALIRELLNPYVGDLMVTPKEIDDIVDIISKIIAIGINIALQPNLLIDEINNFLN